MWVAGRPLVRRAGMSAKDHVQFTLMSGYCDLYKKICDSLIRTFLPVEQCVTTNRGLFPKVAHPPSQCTFRILCIAVHPTRVFANGVSKYLLTNALDHPIPISAIVVCATHEGVAHRRHIGDMEKL